MAIIGFGRRKTVNSDHYIVPPKAWADPENAAFFARIGAKPNDGNNRVVTPDDVTRMIEKGRKAIDERIHAVRAKALADGHRDLHFRALWLLQDPCWNGEAGDFLVYLLGLDPYDDWNMILVADDPRTAAILDIPFCTPEIAEYIGKAGLSRIFHLRDELRAAHEEVQRTHQFGRFADIFEDTTAKVKQLAGIFRSVLIETYQAFLREEANRGSVPR